MDARAGDEPQRLGRYLLFDNIGSGGMATVHLGKLEGPSGFSRVVAIKRPHAEYASKSEFVAMFLDEARLAARLRHPNVVPTLEIIVDGRSIGLVMEYVHGETLSRLLRMVTPTTAIALPIASGIAIGMLQGLHAAHEAKDDRGQPLGIIHRDVSPQNVIVGVDGVPRVVDFGVAKASSRLTQTTHDGTLKGKVAYMCPEHILNGPATRRFDVYAAAVVLWEMLASKRLFSTDMDAIVFATTPDATLKPPSVYRPNIPRSVDDVVMRGLARDPAQRYATAREMAIALGQALPPASATEIGEWVEAIAAEAMRIRVARVAAIERGDGDAMSDAHKILSHVTGKVDLTTEAGSSTSRTAPVQPARRRAALPIAAVVIALAVLVVLALLVVIVGPRLRTAPATREVAAVSASSPPAPSAAVTASTLVPIEAASASAAVYASAIVVKTRAPAVPRATAHPVSSAPSASCDPPYTYDAEGHKIYKVECLR